MNRVSETAERSGSSPTSATGTLDQTAGTSPGTAVAPHSSSSGPLELFDVVVLGGGPGGAAAALAARESGRSVALIDTTTPEHCSWHNPSSGHTLMEITSSIHAARRAAGRGVRTTVKVDFAEVMATVVTGAAEYEEDADLAMLADRGVEVLAGQPRFLGTDRIEVDDRRLQGRRFILAAGGVCRVPAIAGLADVPHLTSATLWDLRICPQQLLILGSGAEACEMAQAFARLGARVTLLRSEPRLLPGLEPEAARLITTVLRREGVEIADLPANSTVSGTDGHIEVVAGAKTYSGTQLLLAEGCAPHTADLALELPGVAVDAAGRVLVDDRLRSVSAPSLYAVGHCAGDHTSTEVADEQGRLAVRNLIWDDRPRRIALPSLDAIPGKWHSEHVPSTVFTDPQIATVGMTEAQAAEKYGAKARVAMVPLASLDRAHGAGPADGFVKLVAAPGLLGAKTLLRLIGMTVVGPNAGETLSAGALAIRAGLPMSRLASTLTPTGASARATRLAASLFFAPQNGLSDRPAVP